MLNELSYQMFIPVIDAGVGIDSHNGEMGGGAVRVNIIGPSLPCLYCAGVISPDGILAESPNPAGRNGRGKRGYVEGQSHDDAPSVVSLTTTAAGLAVFLLKDVLFSVSGADASMVVFDIGTLSARTLSPKARPGCVCTQRTGMGDCKPMSAPWRSGGR